MILLDQRTVDWHMCHTLSNHNSHVIIILLLFCWLHALLTATIRRMGESEVCGFEQDGRAVACGNACIVFGILCGLHVRTSSVVSRANFVMYVHCRFTLLEIST